MRNGIEGWIFRPRLAGATGLQRLIACAGAAGAILLSYLACTTVGFGHAGLPILTGPVGASAVLVFAVPASPLAQPWPVIGGTVISAIIGVAAARLTSDTAMAAGLAIGMAILLMSLLRCLHPPGGAAALITAMGGPAVQEAGYAFALTPIGVNCVAIVLCALFYHRFTGHSYPHRPGVPALAPAADPAPASGLHVEDIDRALADLDETFDISREDLDLLLDRAALHARARCGRS